MGENEFGDQLNAGALFAVTGLGVKGLPMANVRVQIHFKPYIRVFCNICFYGSQNKKVTFGITNNIDPYFNYLFFYALESFQYRAQQRKITANVEDKQFSLMRKIYFSVLLKPIEVQHEVHKDNDTF